MLFDKITINIYFIELTETLLFIIDIDIVF